MPWGPTGWTEIAIPIVSDPAYINGWQTWNRVNALRVARGLSLPAPVTPFSVNTLDANDAIGYAFGYLGLYLRGARGDYASNFYSTVVNPATGSIWEQARNAITTWTAQVNAAYPPTASDPAYLTPTPIVPTGVQTTAQAIALQLAAQQQQQAQQQTRFVAREPPQNIELIPESAVTQTNTNPNTTQGSVADVASSPLLLLGVAAVLLFVFTRK